MLDPARNDQEFPRLQLNRAIAKFHAHSPTPDEKHFIFVLMMVPKEFTFELDDFHFLAIQLAHDLGPPMFRERRELFRQSYFFHCVVMPIFVSVSYLPETDIAYVITAQTAVIRTIARMKIPSANRSTRCIRRTLRVRSAQ